MSRELKSVSQMAHITEKQKEKLDKLADRAGMNPWAYLRFLIDIASHRTYKDSGFYR